MVTVLSPLNALRANPGGLARCHAVLKLSARLLFDQLPIAAIPDIVNLLRKKTRRIVISTNGYFTDRIIDLCNRFPDTGIRISIEG